MCNWVLNPSGNPNSFVEVDLVQEHMNYWIKVSHRPSSKRNRGSLIKLLHSYFTKLMGPTQHGNG
jgi:hypothetical protein